MHSSLDLEKTHKRPVDWSMIVLMALSAVYVGCVAGLIAANAGVIQ